MTTNAEDRSVFDASNTRREQVSVTLDAELKSKVERAAAQERRTRSAQIAYLLEKAFERQDQGVAA